MEPLTKELLNYSVLGIVCLVLGKVVHFLYKEMKSDRQDWQKTLEGNTEVLKDLKGLLERKR